MKILKLKSLFPVCQQNYGLLYEIQTNPYSLPQDYRSINPSAHTFMRASLVNAGSVGPVKLSGSTHMIKI